LNKKTIVSIRFGKKDPMRITESEWETFRHLVDYFNVSESALVETALRYTKRNSSVTIGKYVFEEETFCRYAGIGSGLDCLIQSLRRGRLEKPIKIKSEGLAIDLPTDTRVRYDAPYIIRIEPDANTRIHLDLAEKIFVIDDGERFEICC